jgi:predicted NBD/HSP70 family sugar kinase
MAGEIGHIIVDPEGPLCSCGARGCLETVAAGPAIARQGQQAVESEADTLLRQMQPVTAQGSTSRPALVMEWRKPS